MSNVRKNFTEKLQHFLSLLQFAFSIYIMFLTFRILFESMEQQNENNYINITAFKITFKLLPKKKIISINTFLVKSRAHSILCYSSVYSKLYNIRWRIFCVARQEYANNRKRRQTQ